MRGDLREAIWDVGWDATSLRLYRTLCERDLIEGRCGKRDIFETKWDATSWP